MALAHKLTLTGVLVLVTSAAAIAQAPARPSPPELDGAMQVGRYTTASAEPAAEVSDPLAVQARLTYPRQTVRSVGDAIDHTLLRTGWRLVSPSALEPDAARFLHLPLPESQRTLGPYRVRTILNVLLGSTWQWHEDPVQRLVWFTRAEAPRRTATATRQTPAPVQDRQGAPVLPEPSASPALQAQPEPAADPGENARAVMPNAGEF